MSTTINGVAIRWGLPNFGISESSVGALIMQDAEHSKVDDPETIKDKDGATVTRIWPDARQEVTFNYFVKAASGTNTVANAKTQSKIPAPGTIVTITMTSSEDGDTFDQQKAEVQSAPKKQYTNTGAVKVSLPLIIWPNITASVS